MANHATAPLKLKGLYFEILEKYIRKRNIGHHELKRIKIILKGSQGQSNYSISKEVGLGVEAVSTWRKRWQESYDQLQIFEKGETGQGVSNLVLLNKMLSILKDRPRSGKPVQISMSQKKQIVALACKKPSEYNIPITRWTNKMLAKVAKSEKVVESISPAYVGRVLKKSGHTSS